MKKDIQGPKDTYRTPNEYNVFSLCLNIVPQVTFTTSCGRAFQTGIILLAKNDLVTLFLTKGIFNLSRCPLVWWILMSNSKNSSKEREMCVCIILKQSIRSVHSLLSSRDGKLLAISLSAYGRS